jgi:CRP-like cAMP-binding protein
MKTLSETDKEFVCDIQAPCFQKLSREEVEFVRGSKTQVLFRKGENLTKQGAFASYVLFIINGLVKQYVEGDTTRNFNLSIMKSGDFVGLSAVFTKNIFNYSAVALHDTLVYLVDKDTIASLVQNNGQFAYAIIKRYCEQDSGLYDIIRNMMYKQMNGRLADALLYLGSDNFAGEELFTALSRKDIADFAGISTESAVKLLKIFEREGLIELDEKNIRVTNTEALSEISKRG